MPLEDYKDIVGAAASLATVGQMLSGVFVCRDIVREGTTKNVQPLMFVGGVGMCMLMFKYAVVINDPGMYPVNIIATLLNVGYLICYWIYTSEKVELIKYIMKTAIFFGSILLYLFFEAPENVEFRFGIIMTVLMFMLIASPFLQLGVVMRTGSTESLAFAPILSGTLVSFLWLIYGVILDNGFMQIQNIVALALSVGQLSLFVIYPRKTSTKKEKSI